MPEPSADQLLPSHLAMLVATMPPAVVKAPPAYRLLPDTVSAYTQLSIPEPSAVQLVPFHLAMLSWTAPWEMPPAYRLVPEIANALTPKSPISRYDQQLPSHLAIPSPLQ